MWSLSARVQRGLAYVTTQFSLVIHLSLWTDPCHVHILHWWQLFGGLIKMFPFTLTKKFHVPNLPQYSSWKNNFEHCNTSCSCHNTPGKLSHWCFKGTDDFLLHEPAFLPIFQTKATCHLFFVVTCHWQELPLQWMFGLLSSSPSIHYNSRPSSQLLCFSYMSWLLANDMQWWHSIKLTCYFTFNKKYDGSLVCQCVSECEWQVNMSEKLVSSKHNHSKKNKIK